MNRAEATWEQVKRDGVTEPGKKAEGLDRIGNIAVKAHDVWSNLYSVVLGPLDKEQYLVKQREGILDATRAKFDETLHKRWFKKGNPLNIVPKALTAVTELPDGLINDALHIIGGGTNGYVVRRAA